LLALTLAAWASASSVGWSQALSPEAEIVRDVEFKWFGPETVSRQILEARVQTAKGQPFSRLKVEQDVRNLMDTGYFLNVRVVEEPFQDGLRIRFELQGKSSIRQVVITGNRRIKEDKLRQKLKTQAGQTLNERRVHEDRAALIEYYQKAGYQDARVTDSISFDPDTGKSVVTFTIEEGEKVVIAAVKFTGVTAFKQSQLRKLMKTKKHWLFSWVTGGGRLKDDQFQEDLEAVRAFYHSRGYIDMDYVRNEQNERRGYRVERPSRTRAVIIIDIFEGKQYKVGDVALAGNKLFPTANITKWLKLKGGTLFTPDGLANDIKTIQDYYGSKGYLDTAVRAVKSPNPETGGMDLRYEIREGELSYIEKITIRGNHKTRDKVIRRELAVTPGDVYDSVRVDRSRQRLENLGYFSRVSMLPEATDIPNHPDLVVEVEEQRTGQLGFGGGFSSIDNLIGFVEVAQGNFDLFGWPSFTGGGQKLRLRAQFGTRRQDYLLSFTEPWFLNQRLALGFDAFHTRSDYFSAKYSESRTGGNLRLEKALGEWWRVNWKYGLEDIDLGIDTSASAVLQAERGRRTKSYMVFGASRDTRDSVFLTTRGNRTDLTAEIAGGPLSGTVDIYKLQLGTSFYFPMIFEKHVLLLQGNIGVVNQWADGNRVPLFDRFFLGGANSIRGFKYRDISPRDDQNEPVGGKTFWNTTVEYGFPIVERIRGALFVDAGNVYRTAYSLEAGQDPVPGGGVVNREAINVGAGFGFRFNLPIGPLRFDLGFPIISDDTSDRGMQFHFNVGYQF
jgi:outer membrane protein insertion porin family